MFNNNVVRAYNKPHMRRVHLQVLQKTKEKKKEKENQDKMEDL